MMDLVGKGKKQGRQEGKPYKSLGVIATGEV